MKLNLKRELLNLRGEALKMENEITTLGVALSNILISAQEGGKMKLYILAQKCYNDETIDLDSADFAMVKSVVSRTTIYNALVSGQIEKILEDIKDEEDEKRTKSNKKS